MKKEMAIQELEKGLLLITGLWLIMNDDQSELVRGIITSLQAVISLLQSSEEISDKGVQRSNLEDHNPRGLKRRKQLHPNKIITDSPFGDAYRYRWRKYGQKFIGNAKYPRCYYKCTYPDCNAKKQVQQQNSSFPPEYEVIFNNIPHTCNSTTIIPISQPIFPSQNIISFDSKNSGPRSEDGDVLTSKLYGSDSSVCKDLDENLASGSTY